jgi:Mg-chelatase subunit ChlD
MPHNRKHLDALGKTLRTAFLSMFAILLCAMAAAAPALDAAPLTGAKHIDAVLVIDTSQSMRTSDKNRLAIAGAKIFVDMLEANGSNVAVIGFNGNVVLDIPMTGIGSAESRQAVKTKLDALRFVGYTDMGRALKAAEAYLDGSIGVADASPVIIMFTDGYIDVNERGRTESQSKQEVYEVAGSAEGKYPIYTIGLNGGSEVDEALLKDIAASTGAKNYMTTDPDELRDIFNDIFADIIGSERIVVGKVVTDGENYNLIDINIPNSYVAEANVLMQSGEQLIDVSLKNPDDSMVELTEENGVYFSKEDKYSIIKIASPARGNWLLGIKGIKDDEVTISLLYNYELSLSARILQAGPYAAGDEVTVVGEFVDAGGKPLASGVSAAIAGNVSVKAEGGAEIGEIKMDNSGGRLSAKYVLPQGYPSVYFVVSSSGEGFFRESQPLRVAVSKAAPTATPPQSTPAPPTPAATATPRPARIGPIFFVHFPLIGNGGRFDASDRIDGLIGKPSVECEDPNAAFEVDGTAVSVKAASKLKLLNAKATLKYTDPGGAQTLEFRVVGLPGAYLFPLALLAAAFLLRERIGQLMRKLKKVPLFGRLLCSVARDGVYDPEPPPVDLSYARLKGSVPLEKIVKIDGFPQLKGIRVRQLLPGQDSPDYRLEFRNKSQCRMSANSLAFGETLAIEAADGPSTVTLSLTYDGDN